MPFEPRTRCARDTSVSACDDVSMRSSRMWSQENYDERNRHMKEINAFHAAIKKIYSKHFILPSVN